MKLICPKYGNCIDDYVDRLDESSFNIQESYITNKNIRLYCSKSLYENSYRSFSFNKVTSIESPLLINNKITIESIKMIDQNIKKFEFYDVDQTVICSLDKPTSCSDLNIQIEDQTFILPASMFLINIATDFYNSSLYIEIVKNDIINIGTVVNNSSVNKNIPEHINSSINNKSVVSTNSEPFSESKNGGNVAAIIVGTLVIFILLIMIIWFIKRYNKRSFVMKFNGSKQWYDQNPYLDSQL